MKIINILIFVGAFILVTAGLIFLNSAYTNIFRLDFSVQENTIVKDSTKSDKNKKDNVIPPAADIFISDTIKSSDTLTAQVNPLVDSVKTPVIQKTTQQIPETTKQISEVKEEKLPEEKLPEIKINKETDSTYIKWVKDTAKMFESMEPKKAAKIIANYSDDTARDIMYKMKKKKAAEILAELDPVAANRITRYWEKF